MAAEAKLTEMCIKHMKELKRAGLPIEWLKVHGSGMQRRGEPDLSITFYGRSVKVEIKADANRPTKLQAYRLQQWEAAGAVVGIARSIGDLRQILNKAARTTVIR